MIDDLEISNALLPVGFCDVLPSDAEIEARGLQNMMDIFAIYGYERVSPPLLEFERSLLAYAGKGIAEQTFRIMDPETRYMMGVRADITPQIARIAATRLINAPRPLRLSYAGFCIWVKGAGHSASRQILQTGIELIGIDNAQADAEVILVTAQALQALGIQAFSFDLMMPQLVQTIIQSDQFSPTQYNALMRALDRKDVSAVSYYGGTFSNILIKMLQAAGPAERAIHMLQKLDFSVEARYMFDRLVASVKAVQKQSLEIELTIDPVEFRGWDYHTGLCISVYVEGISGEVGRGGRYISNNQEPACGLTLRPDILLQSVDVPLTKPKVFVPYGCKIEDLNRLHEKGYITLMGLMATDDARKEAQRLNCQYIYEHGSLRDL